jgi:1-deoxy-D-xylulose-5-phosphate reductoisomerase
MRVPIAFGLSFPDRMESGASQLDFGSLSSLTFENPDFSRYPGLRLAWDTLRGPEGSTTVLNAANEVAVAAFLAGTIGFHQIHSVNAGALASLTIERGEAASIDALIALDERSRAAASQLVRRVAR